MGIRQDQCNKVCRIIDDYLANRPRERDELIVAVRTVFKEADRKTEPQRDCDADCNEDCTECAKETELWKAEQTEPQTSKIIEAYSRGFKDGADAVKSIPQTDCSWKKGE